jgi:GST-like protein
MIDLHTTATANGYRVSIMLEECGLPYRVHAYDLLKGDQLRPEFLALHPVGRVPAIVDAPDVDDPDLDEPEGRRIVVAGTHAILQYLAEKTGRFLPSEPVARAAAYTWAGVASSDVAPAFSGQFTFGVLMPGQAPPALAYFEKLCLRFLAALDTRLATATWLAGDEYSIADMLAYPTVAVSAKRFPGNVDAYPHVSRWSAAVGQRPAVQRGMRVPS